MQNYNLTTAHLNNYYYRFGSRLWVFRSAVLQSKDLAFNNCWLLLLPPLIGWAQWAGPPQHQSIVLSDAIWWHHIPLVWIRLRVLAVRRPAELTLTTGWSHQWHERVHAVEMRKKKVQYLLIYNSLFCRCLHFCHTFLLQMRCWKNYQMSVKTFTLLQKRFQTLLFKLSILEKKSQNIKQRYCFQQ